jgi:hypothetical protein
MASCPRTSVKASTRPCADVAAAEDEYQNVICRCRRRERRQCGTQIPGKPVARTGEPISLKPYIIPSENGRFKFQRELSCRRKYIPEVASQTKFANRPLQGNQAKSYALMRKSTCWLLDGFFVSLVSLEKSFKKPFTVSRVCM